MTTFFGIDLAWGEGSRAKPANETGLVHLDGSGTVLDAGWARGVPDVVAWLVGSVSPGDMVAVDAPLLVLNPTGMRDCEKEVGRRYGRWKVSANPSNLALAWSAGLTLRAELESVGFLYTDGLTSPPPTAITMFECYPYTTLVGSEELGYDVERPRYKRPNTALPLADRRVFRAAQFDELVLRMRGLSTASPPLDLLSHPVTRLLVDSPAPLVDRLYKHAEDLLDAALCAWTASLWHRFGLERCQVLGADSEPDARGRRGTIIAPARSSQRR